MATGDFFGNLKQKVRSLYNNFFYDGAEAPVPRGMQEEVYPDEQQPYGQQMPQNYQQAQYQASYGQQQAQAYAAYSPQAQSYQPQHRNRRAQQHAEQAESNVVDFGAYQHQAYQQPAQAAYQQPSQHYQQPQGYQQAPSYQQQPAPAAPAMEAQPVQPAPVAQGQSCARVINARGMGDCRSAITLLRNGDAVLIVLENVTDPAEMRRLVDTLSGACYSLTATITKVSRYGVYLLAPQTMAVYADQVTNQMNSPGRAPLRGYQNTYGGQRPMYQSAPQAPAMGGYAPQQGFTQRPNPVEEAAQPFYARTAPQAAQVPSFSAQPAGYGYAPDETEAAAADQ